MKGNKKTYGVPDYKTIEGKRYFSLHDNPITKKEAKNKAERLRETSVYSVRVVKVKGGYAVYREK